MSTVDKCTKSKRIIIEAYEPKSIDYYRNMGINPYYNMLNNEYYERKEDYDSYLKKHINNVVRAYQEYIKPLLHYDFDIECPFTLDELEKAIGDLDRHIGLHDFSKWSEDEYEPYREHWNPTEDEVSSNMEKSINNIEYEEAWAHHKANNPHHPTYWEGKDMPLSYILEMICDWIGVSEVYHSNLIDWYESKASTEKKAMSKKTKSIVEYLIYKVFKFNNKDEYVEYFEDEN